MTAIAKRFLNVATVVCSLFALLFIGIAVMGGVSNWYEYIAATFFPTLGGYVAILVTNYVAFGQVTLWHKVP